MSSSGLDLELVRPSIANRCVAAPRRAPCRRARRRRAPHRRLAGRRRRPARRRSFPVSAARDIVRAVLREKVPRADKVTAEVTRDLAETVKARLKGASLRAPAQPGPRGSRGSPPARLGFATAPRR